MWSLAPTLNVGSVTLEPLAEQHREPLWEAAQPLQIWDWWTEIPSSSRDAWNTWFDNCLKNGHDRSEQHFATIADGVPSGSTSYCSIREEWFALEIGWTWLTPGVWGRNVNTAAKYLQLKYAFEQLGCFRVEWDTAAENARSRAALAKLGAQFEGIHRDSWVKEPGTIRLSSAFYSMLDHEWPAAKQQLEQRLGL